jgi:cell division protein FtsB
MASFSRFMRSFVLITLLLAASIAVPLQVFGPQGIDRVARLQEEFETLEEHNKQIARENQAIRSEIGAFHANPEYIEKVARDELGMVCQDEIIYQFPE